MPLSPLPDARAPWARGEVGRRFRTIGLSVLAFCDPVLSSTYWDGREAVSKGVLGDPPPDSGMSLVYFAIAVAWVIGVVNRRRFPVPLAVVGSVLPFLLLLGPTAALIGLTSVILHRQRETAIAVGVLVAGATGWSIWRDLHTLPREYSFWGSLFAKGYEPAPGAAAPAVALALVGTFVGVGIWLRTRADLRAVQEVATEGREQVTSLTDQVSRQAERERLAREIHDGLGHKLSILSAHAGTIQAAGDKAADDLDPRTRALLKQSADVVQTTAADSVRELQDLLNLLRSPDDPDIAAPTKTLRDVRALVDESVAAGMPLIATVYVDDSEACDPHIAQASFRIVQELLTNARKHARGVPVRLTVSGGPADGGITIATANQLPPPAWPQPPAGAERARAGTGLSGIRERAERWGGSVASGVDEHAAWRVSVWLPWTPTPTRGGWSG